jgi:hypothetical protein
MTEDQFFDRLRDDARSLRYEADAFMTTRITALVRERISAAPTVSLILARWLRPVAASLTALALAGCISAAIVERSSTNSASVESLSANNAMEISMAGDTYRVGE